MINKQRGDIKIFDFGLAKELPPDEEADSDNAWKMTGETGTPRYVSFYCIKKRILYGKFF